MKKIFILLAVLNSMQGFSQSFLYRHDKSTWYSLFAYVIIFLGIITYLFVKYRFEQMQKNKHSETKENNNPGNELATNATGSEDLFTLFMLKRKGVISKFEYDRLKQRALKRKTSSIERLEGASLAH